MILLYTGELKAGICILAHERIKGQTMSGGFFLKRKPMTISSLSLDFLE
jgi:hypothetical protein